MSPKKNTNLVPRITALCYVRQSYTRDKDDMNSPDRQQANIKALCERNGWTPEWYKDADGHKSGRFEKNRPGWLALKERLDDPDVVALVANDLSRLHRKGWRVGDLVEFVNEHDVSLVLAAPGREVDTSSPTGRMFILFSAIFDEYYAEDAAQRQRDNIAFRRSLDKSVGIPSFGTVRGRDGYLQPSPYGAWLLPDGSHVAGKRDENPPQEGATWRGYYECAERILTLYINNKYGHDRIAYQMNEEGWAFRNRKHNPRPINRGDVRRVIGAWRAYAGFALPGRAKDQNASMMENPTSVLVETKHGVFDLSLIRTVAEIQQYRSVTTRAPGSKKAAYTYVLTDLLYCAHCERKSQETNNLQFRSHLAGWDRYSTKRYRHTEGRPCDSRNRSVHIDLVEADFARLIHLLTINPNDFPLMTELALQLEDGNLSNPDRNLEEEKQIAIARCRRRIENGKALCLSGDIEAAEYLRIKEHNEREIAHWEASTTDNQEAALELAMCMDALEKMTRLWDMASNEDKQGMARTLFEYVVSVNHGLGK